MKKYLLSYLLNFLLLILLMGCGSKKFYTLGDNIEVKNHHNFSQNIDVLKVKVPKYLQENKIVRQVSPYQIELIDNTDWLIPMEKKLTQMLIEYLQTSLNNPNVHLYPWESDNKTNIRVSVDIKKFIASKEVVVLKANYKIMNLEQRTHQLKSFETKKATTAKMEDMMRSMEEAYTLLLEDIQTTIINNK